MFRLSLLNTHLPMLTRTKAIVLHLTKHNDTSSIAHLFTDTHGRVSIMVYGLSGKRSSMTSAAFAPLNIIELNADFDRENIMPRINTKSIEILQHSAHSNITQKTQLIFIAELLYSVLTHQLQDTALFNWLATQIYDLSSHTSPDKHLSIMLQLTHFLGITPQIDTPDRKSTRLNSSH